MIGTDILLKGHWRLEHFRKKKSGKLWLIDDQQWDNVITTLGKNNVLDVYLAGATQDATWFVGLKGTGTAVVGDTLASHAGWSEINPYTGNRPAFTPGAAAAGSIDNAASKAVFAITSSVTVYGAFLAGVNTGTSGLLYAAGDFASSRAVVSGDTLNITATFTAS